MSIPSLWKLVSSGATKLLKPAVDAWGVSIPGTITLTGGITSDGNLIIDKTDSEALLIRKDADGGDFLAIDTTALRALLTQNGIGTISTTYDATGTGLILANETPTTVGAPVQVSPALRFRGHAWDLDDAVDRKVEWRLIMSPVSANTPIASMLLQYRLQDNPDTAVWVTKATFASSGNYIAAGSLLSTGSVNVGSVIVESAESFLTLIGGTSVQALSPVKGVSFCEAVSTAGTNIVALTLADGTTEGQRKSIRIGGVAGATFVLTPTTTFGAWTTITWTEAGGVDLIWMASGWALDKMGTVA